jgi:uncharacterized protein YdhG (YjbR/CyaY superfamily)
MGEIDDYLAALDEDSRAAFERVLATALALVPEAEQGSSYGMAALRYRGKPLLGFRAATGHLSVFPFSPAAVEASADTLVGFDRSKGTVRFTAAHPLPDAAVRALVQHRSGEITGRTAGPDGRAVPTG